MKSTCSFSALVVAVALSLSAGSATAFAAAAVPTVMGNEPLAPGKFVWDAKTAAAGRSRSFFPCSGRTSRESSRQ